MSVFFIFAFTKLFVALLKTVLKTVTASTHNMRQHCSEKDEVLILNFVLLVMFCCVDADAFKLSREPNRQISVEIWINVFWFGRT